MKTTRPHEETGATKSGQKQQLQQLMRILWSSTKNYHVSLWLQVWL